MKSATFKRPHLTEHIEATIAEAQEINLKMGEHQQTFCFEITGELACLDIENAPCEDLTFAAVEMIFLNYPVTTVQIINSDSIERNDLRHVRQNGEITLKREVFSQLAGIWTSRANLMTTPTEWTKSKEVLHPKRALTAPGTILYARLSPLIGKTISFRAIEIEKDLELFFEWHHKARVLKFWELALAKDELRRYLENGQKDAHQIPAIVEIDGRPVGYYEFYWVKEDRLGPIYDSKHFDRGFHFLIGEDDCLGFKNTDAILKATCHYIFLDEARTEIIAAEPRSDNVAILKYVETFYSWRKVKEFDFPHKRAALLECRRDLYFSAGHPWI